MNKYSSNRIYKGNLIKYKSGKYVIYKENTELIYDETTDLFYSYVDVFNLILSNNLDDLSIEEYQKNKRIIDKYSYPYHLSGIDNFVYVDEASIKEVYTTYNKGKNR